MLQVFAGTILLASLLAAAGVWVLFSAVSQLEDAQAEPIDVRAGRTSRPEEAPAQPWTEAGHLSATRRGISQHRIVRRGGTTAHPRGPARLSGRDGPPAGTAA
jgi:hypothetical protein